MVIWNQFQLTKPTSNRTYLVRRADGQETKAEWNGKIFLFKGLMPMGDITHWHPLSNGCNAVSDYRKK